MYTDLVLSASIMNRYTTFVMYLALLSLVPRLSQFLVTRKTWEWPGDEARLYLLAIAGHLEHRIGVSQ